MLTGIASTHLDYLIFLGGTGLAALAAHAVSLLISGNRKAPWGWLALAGGLVAIADWVWIPLLGRGETPHAVSAELFLGGLGVLALIMFATLGARRVRGIGAIKWVLAAAVAIMGAGFVVGGRAATLGVVGLGAAACLASATLLIRLGLDESTPARLPLFGLGAGFAAYGVAALFSVPPAQLMAETVRAVQPAITAAALAQVARTCASVFMAVSLGVHVMQLERADQDDTVRGFVVPVAAGLLVLVMITVVAGWGITVQATDIGWKEARGDLVQAGRTVAGSLGTERVRDLAEALSRGGSPDLVKESSADLASGLEGVRLANADLIGIHLVARTHRGPVIAAESVAKGTARVPGASCQASWSRLAGAFADGSPVFEGPEGVPAGMSYTAFVPVRDPKTSEILALVAVDRDAAAVLGEVESWRLNGVLIALLSTVIVLGLYLAFHSSVAWMRRISRSEKRFRIVFDAAPEAILTVEPESFRIVDANEAAVRWLGYGEQELEGLSLIDLAGGGRGAAWAFATAAREAELASPACGRFLKADGNVVDVEMTAASIEQDGHERLLMFCRDVTLRRRAEEATAEARSAAESANRAKSAFLATMSHEIRTPMNAVIGMDELLLGTRLTAEQERYVRTGLAAGEHLLELINDVLDLSKIEADKLELEKRPFDIRGLLEQVVDVVGVTARAKGLELSGRVLDDVPAVLIGDPCRLRQVLTNLLGNAVKFTSQGGVTAKVAAQSPNGDGLRRFEFTVTDTGAGIPAEKLQEIFEAFTQADVSTARTHGGTGLGLAISKRIIETAGGRISVESRPGEGSTFTFVMPLGVVTGSAPDAIEAPPCLPAPVSETARAADTAAEPARAPLRILLAEDSPDNRFLVEAYLSGTGHVLDQTVDGEEAVARFEDAGPDAYDLVLMDMQMPKKDGYDATREIREWEKANGAGHTPVVALTAYSLDVEAKQSLDAGCDGHLVKPIKKAVLLAALSRYARARDVVAASQGVCDD